jgi:hypothetical protein
VTDRRRLVPIGEPETDREGLRHAACGATSREDPRSIAADGLARPRRGPRASSTERAASIEEEAAIISMTDRRLAALPVALGFLQIPPRAPELRLLHRWLDTWTGVGLIVVGVERQVLRFSLSHIAEGEWRARPS